jgi:hypothetical protein
MHADSDMHSSYSSSVMSSQMSSSVSSSMSSSMRSSSSSSSDSQETVFVSATCLRGDVSFKEGYNAVIRQENQRNAIIIGAGVGSGEGEPCEEVPVYDDEAPPSGSPFLSGGPSCATVIQAVNGIGGPHISLRGGQGVTVTTDPEDENGILVTVGLTQFAECPVVVPEDDSSSLSEGA